MAVNLGALLVAVLFVGVHASRWRLAAQSLDSDLDSLLCVPRDYPGVIIDIHESMEKGAELLDGVWAANVAACMSGCCKAAGCDLALFKNEGTSKTGKNCYYVHCGELDNCVMVQHPSFTTIAFLTEETRTGHAPKSETTAHSPSATTSAPTLVPVSTVMPTTSPVTELPTTATPSDSNAGEDGGANDDGGISPGDGEDGGVSPGDGEDGGVSPGDGEDGGVSLGDGKDGGVSPGEDGGVSPSNGKDGGVSLGNAKSPSNVEEGPGKGETEQGGKSGKGRDKAKSDDGCSKYGCDGSGVVAVVVVAVICFAIVLVVVAILMKKVVDDRRRRKFRNVDYLINGMYT